MKQQPAALTNAQPRAATWLVPAVLLLALVFPRHDWEHYFNVNEAARIYLVQAVVDRRVLHIDEGIRQYGDVHDKAEHGGHFYCDKPIGLSLVAVPVYAGLKAVGSMMGHVWTPNQLRYALTIFCVSLPTVAAAWWLRRYWSDLTGDAILADFALLAYGLGTIAFTYATQFMGHQLAAVLAVGHFAIARRIMRGQSQRAALLLAGLVAGLAAITEYFSAFTHLIIACSYVPKVKPRPHAAYLIVGGLVGVVPLLIYNTMCFGGPFSMAYAHESLGVFKELHSTGFLGVTFPKIESVWGLLFSAPKGLFFLSPFLFLALCGVGPGWSDRALRREFVVITACAAVIMLLATSLHEWRAGRTVGPRHMVSMLPFLMSLAVFGVAKRRALLPWFVGLSLLGIAFVGLATLTLPAFDVNFENPLASQAFFLARQGLVSGNLGHAIGLSGTWSLLPLLAALLVALVLLAVRAGRAGRQVITWPAIGALTLAAGWFVAVVAYEPDHPRLLTSLQGKVLWEVDRLPLAAAFLEKSIEGLEADPRLEPASKRDLFQIALPILMAIYQEQGDTVRHAELRRRIERMERGGVGG